MTRLAASERIAVSAAMTLLAARDKWCAGDQAALADLLVFAAPGPAGLLSLDDMPMVAFGFACSTLRDLLAVVERLDGDRVAAAL